jgi:hypothetical protein
MKKLIEGESNAQKTIDILGVWKHLRTYLFYRSRDFKRSMKRGVKIRLLTEKHEKNELSQKVIQTLKMNPLFEIRYLPKKIHNAIGLYDGKELNMRISELNIGYVCLWSSNAFFVEIISAYFESLWNKAQDAPTL